MTNDPDDELPPLPEDVGVDVLTARMERLEDTILRGVSRIEQLEASVTQQTATIAKGSANLERQVHRFTVHSLWSFGSGILLAALALLAVGVAIGQQWGRQEGYDEASTEKAGASWGATDEGRWAYAFAQTGDLAMIRNCSNKGWQVFKGTCSPQAASDHMIYGWHLIDRPTLPVRHKARKTP
jgi:uncharacterized coiled-coil protein SlyX